MLAKTLDLIPEKTISIWSKRRKPKPSIVYNTYWKFATKRQEVFFKRFNGESFPWSKDVILNQYKFTNVYRASDRVSQYLIKNVIYKGSQNPVEIFFRILLFKIFNRISTWEYLEEKLGKLSFKNYSFRKYNTILTELMKNKIPIYSAAYLINCNIARAWDLRINFCTVIQLSVIF